MEKKRFLILILFFVVFLIEIVSAPFGYDNPTLPNIEEEQIITYRNITTYNINSTDFWDSLDTPANINHNTLGGPQGGQAGEYYHLNQSFFDKLVSDIFNWIKNNTLVYFSQVGIGTNAPDSILHIKANVVGTVGSHPAGQLIIQDPDDTVFGNAVITGYESDGAGNPDQQLWYLGSSSSSNSNIIFLNRRNSKLQLGTNDVSRLTILGDGNVGIGLTNPQKALHVESTAYNSQFMLSRPGQGNWSFAVSGGRLLFNDPVGTVMSIEDDPNSVGINTQTPVGTLNVIGDINSTGIVYGSNLFVPQYLFAHTNMTIPLVTASVWANITFAQEDTDVKSGITHTYNDATNHTFTISQDGIYEIKYDFDIEDTSAVSSDIDVAGRVIYENGTEILGSVFETDIIKKGISTELAYPFLAQLMANDIIVFQFVANDVDVQISTHGTFGDHPESASIIIQKVANL